MAFMKQAIGVFKMCLEMMAVMPVTVGQCCHTMNRIFRVCHRHAYADRLA
jgi:hypothetical protein